MDKKTRVAVGLSEKEIEHLDKRALERYGDSNFRRADVLRKMVREDMEKQGTNG